MVLIRVPRPPKDAYNPDREAGSLLKAQLAHAHEAERKLPIRYRQNIDIYASAVRTEREAAEFLCQVTEAVHKAHEDAAVRREREQAKPTLEIAAAAEETRPGRKSRSSGTKKKKSSAKSTSSGTKSAAKKSTRKAGAKITAKSRK